MKLGYITRPNVKGQIVIPRPLRRELGITPSVALNVVRWGDGLYLGPVTAVINAAAPGAGSYAHILAATKGAWGAKTIAAKRGRRARELHAAQERRSALW